MEILINSNKKKKGLTHKCVTSRSFHNVYYCVVGLTLCFRVSLFIIIQLSAVSLHRTVPQVFTRLLLDKILNERVSCQLLLLVLSYSIIKAYIPIKEEIVDGF